MHLALNIARYLQVLFEPSSRTLTSISCFAPCILTMRSYDLYNPSPSSHISPWCLTEACDIVLIFTLLFSIKGQTVQNSTVIPHTLCSHLTPVSFYFLQTVYHVTAQLLNQAFWRRSCDNASLHYIHLILYVTELRPRAYLCTFSPPIQTANQKAASRAGRLSGEGGNPDVSAGRQCKFVYPPKKRCLNSRLICMTTCCQAAFVESVAYPSSARNINLWDIH